MKVILEDHICTESRTLLSLRNATTATIRLTSCSPFAIDIGLKCAPFPCLPTSQRFSKKCTVLCLADTAEANADALAQDSYYYDVYTDTHGKTETDDYFSSAESNSTSHIPYYGKANPLNCFLKCRFVLRPSLERFFSAVAHPTHSRLFSNHCHRSTNSIFLSVGAHHVSDDDD